MFVLHEMYILKKRGYGPYGPIILPKSLNRKNAKRLIKAIQNHTLEENIEQTDYSKNQKYESNNDILRKLLKNTKVKRFLQLSSKKLSDGLDTKETKEYVSLFDDPKVKAYLQAAEDVGRREGWIKGGTFGSLLGGLLGAGVAISEHANIAALALAGALVVGISFGYTLSRIKGMLARWEAESNITKNSNILRVHT